jgi:Uma2 family endonuclease
VETLYAAGSDQVDMPAWVVDFESFRRWMHSAAFPDEGKICFINGKVWVDPLMEARLSHNRVRTEVSRVLANLMIETGFGELLSDGMRYSHLETELSTEPDGMIVSKESRRAGRVRFVSGEKGHQTEVVGSPDVVIEIVSPSSEAKDTEWAMSTYHDAGIPEYWVIDARDKDDIRFDIYKRGKKEYTATRKSGGWVKSAVLGKSFRLTQTEDEDGEPVFTLEVR